MKHDSDILKRIKSYFMRRKSADEAHAFERAAERNPFLYEAMEGIEGMLTSDLQQSMDELDDRLDGKIKSRITINWKLAASVLAILSISGLLFFIVFNNTSSSEEVIVNDQEDHYIPRSHEPSFETIEVPNPVQTNQDSIESFASENKQSEPALDIVESPKVPAIEKMSEKTELFDSKKKDTQSRVDSKASDAIVAADAEIVIMEEDQSFAVSEALTEPILAQPALKKQLSTPTTFQTSPEGAAKSIPSKTSAEPKGGMAAYQAYLKKNLKTYGGMPQGSVSLTFELDRSGSPKKISVAKSLCTACDAEAIRLIENGPTWEANDSKEPVSIKVNFL